MAGKASRENGKKGGRPKGSISDVKKAQIKAFEELKTTILHVQEGLLSAQIGVAKGLTFLYVIRTETAGKKKIKQKPEIVTDPDIIAQYLAEELEDSEDDYYFMSTKEPDSKAIDSLLDRLHGKAKQVIGGEGESPIEIEIDSKLSPEQEQAIVLGITKVFEEQMK